MLYYSNSRNLKGYFLKIFHIYYNIYTILFYPNQTTVNILLVILFKVFSFIKYFQ